MRRPRPRHSLRRSPSRLLLLAALALAGGCADQDEPCPRGEATCPGARAPSWQLNDAQPQSPRHGERYGLEGFRGRVAVLVMIYPQCGNCGPTASAMERMARELRDEGHDVAVVGLVLASTKADLEAVTSAVSFPLFVDEPKVDAWSAQGGGPNELFVYGPSGVLLDHIVNDGTRKVVLGLPDSAPASGYATVKAAIAAAASSVEARRRD